MTITTECQDLCKHQKHLQPAMPEIKIETQGAELVGVKLKCRGCSIEFVHTASQQQHHAEKCPNSHSQPSRCKGCGLKFRQTKAGEMCKAFQNGKCSFGDRCTHSHDTESAAMIAGNNNTSAAPDQLVTRPLPNCMNQFVLDPKCKRWCGYANKTPWCSGCRGQKRAARTCLSMFEPTEYESAEDPECP